MELEAGSPLGCGHGTELPERQGRGEQSEIRRKNCQDGSTGLAVMEGAGAADLLGWLGGGGAGRDLARAQRWYFIELRWTRPMLTTS